MNTAWQKNAHKLELNYTVKQIRCITMSSFGRKQHKISQHISLVSFENKWSGKRANQSFCNYHILKIYPTQFSWHWPLKLRSCNFVKSKLVLKDFLPSFFLSKEGIANVSQIHRVIRYWKSHGTVSLNVGTIVDNISRTPVHFWYWKCRSRFSIEKC